MPTWPTLMVRERSATSSPSSVSRASSASMARSSPRPPPRDWISASNSSWLVPPHAARNRAAATTTAIFHRPDTAETLIRAAGRPDGMKGGDSGIDAKGAGRHAAGVHRVVIVTFPGFQPLDAIGPHEVFAGANRGLPTEDRYELEVVAREPGTVTTESGLGLHAAGLGATTGIGTLLLVGGGGVVEATRDEALVAWIRQAAAGAERVATVCSGTFLAGAAGLIDGRQVTTHWARADRLAERHPTAVVDPDPIYQRD